MSEQSFIKRNLNVPNVLSLIRLLLVPVYAILFVNGQKYTALAVFILASLTDLLDGYIARKHHLITDLGKLLDPFADKLMVLTAMYSMTFGNQVISPVLPLTAVVIVLVKELLMIIGGLYALRKGCVVYSVMIGKVAHCVFIAGLIASYFHDLFVKLCPDWFMTPDLMLIWLAVGLTLCAFCVYAARLIRTLRKKDE